MRVYFDACALNRLTDSPAQLRIREEAKAVEAILSLVAEGRAEWSASTVLRYELGRNPNFHKRSDALYLLSYAGQLRRPEASTYARAQGLERLGYGAYDALHIALAEDSLADVLITTDDRMLRLALRGVGSPSVLLANPLDWWGKVKLP